MTIRERLGSTATTADEAHPAWSYDEFTPLREVIIGSPEGARIPAGPDHSSWLNLYGDLSYPEYARARTGQFPPRVIEETTEDLATLAAILHGLGIVVHRGAPLDHSREFGTPDWRSEGFHSYCPRDLAVVVGSTIIETPSPMRARYFELFGLQPIFQRYLLRGSTWISAPRPRLTAELYQVDEAGRPALGELEPAFEAANILRCGRDIFYQVSTSGNELGRRWLEATLRLLGDFRLHPLRGVYGFTHIDSTISFLRPGLVLINPERVNETNLPQPLRGWDVLWCPPMVDHEPAGEHQPLSSTWLGMNLLMLAPDLALVDARQVDLIRALERRQITVVPHVLRHARTLGGGFHCVTLDTVREGGLVDYFG